jgi:hypothetical protein
MRVFIVSYFLVFSFIGNNHHKLDISNSRLKQAIVKDMDNVIELLLDLCIPLEYIKNVSGMSGVSEALDFVLVF